MKRISMIAMVMAAAMVIGLTACGNSGESSENAAPESEAAPSSQEQQEESETRIFALEEVSRQHTAQIEELQKKTG